MQSFGEKIKDILNKSRRNFKKIERNFIVNNENVKEIQSAWEKIKTNFRKWKT